MEKITLKEFYSLLDEQKEKGLEKNDIAFICPMCKTPQSANDFIKAGVTVEDLPKYTGFSCIGRFTNAGSPRKEPDGKACNWTLGGLFKMHDLVIIDDEGEEHPYFKMATPEQSIAHRDSKVKEKD